MSKLFQTLQQYEMESSDLPSLLSVEGRELFGDLICSPTVESRKPPARLAPLSRLSPLSMMEDELVLWFSQDLIEELAALLPGGYQLSPWAGIEVGGVFFGTKETDGVHVRCYRSIMSDHQHGRSFKLSKRDIDGLTHLLTNANRDEGLNGLVPVGWFHSACNRAAAPNEHDTALHDDFFAEPWQVAMILKGSKDGPVTVCLSFREDQHPIPFETGHLLTLEDFRSESSTETTEAAVRVRLGFDEMFHGEQQGAEPSGSRNGALANANEAEYKREAVELYTSV